MFKIKLLTFLSLFVIASSFILTGCVSTATSESTGQYVDSSSITMKVKTKLLTDPDVKSLPITVNTYKNVVQLSGFVNSQFQRDKAVALAHAVPGVQAVKDSLVIKRK